MYRGRIQKNVPMHRLTWFHVGGPAELMFFPSDVEDLSLFVRNHFDMPKTIIGAASNVLIRDGGILGAVIKLGNGLAQFEPKDNTLFMGAGLFNRIAAEKCQKMGFSGFEFLATIPGTIGGGLRMNAGCQVDIYKSEMCDRLISAWVMDPLGNLHWLSVDELGYGYRSCQLPSDWIFLGGNFKYTPSSSSRIEEVIYLFKQARQKTQPVQVRTGGSTFANPPGHSAWKLIDQAGFRGRVMGGAQFSEKHCNFLINMGNACAKDLETLGEQARDAVFQKTGINLQWEIARLGHSA
jgi:UDP-N-acetylmuramate dehydrogenase